MLYGFIIEFKILASINQNLTEVHFSDLAWLGGSKSSLWFVWKMDTGEYQVRTNIVFN